MNEQTVCKLNNSFYFYFAQARFFGGYFSDAKKNALSE